MSGQRIKVKYNWLSARSIVLTGMMVGILDGTAAAVSGRLSRNESVVSLYQYVASGAFGEAAFSGGYTTASVGVIFHFIIALGWTAFFFIVYPWAELFHGNKIIAGVLYGMFVLLMMKFVVVPLSNVKQGNFSCLSPIEMIIHIAFVGLPISLMANHNYSTQGNSKEQ